VLDGSEASLQVFGSADNAAAGRPRTGLLGASEPLAPPQGPPAAAAALPRSAYISGSLPVVQLDSSYLRKVLGGGVQEAAEAAGDAAGAAAGHRRQGSAGSSAGSEDACGICFDRQVGVQLQACGHRLCGPCYTRVCSSAAGRPGARRQAPAAACPFCRVPICGFDYLAGWVEQKL
jgi:hypothetical protein